MIPRPSFIHLRVHSSYSLSEGAIKVADLVSLCTKHNMPAVAVTDTGNLFCSLEFSKACADSGVQPIIACALDIEAFPAGSSGAASLDKIILYAKNQEGYSNLLALVSQSFLKDTDSAMPPHITLGDLELRHKGLIALTGGAEGTVGRWLAENNSKGAEEALLALKKLFEDNLYIELMRHGLDVEKKIEPGLLELAYKHDIPLVATNDVFFAQQSMHAAHDALSCIAGGRYVEEEDRKKLTPQHYFKTASEMKALFADIPEAIENTVVIAKRCAVKSEGRAPILPRFATEGGKDEAEALREEARKGLEERLQSYDESVKEAYYARLEFELDVIISMQFPGYFLIVSDFIRWSKGQGIPVGPGRGSGAGSVVAWSLSITDLDPIRFGLLFERFLNPERVSMPDFDIDFCQERRDEVISYVQQKYGHDKVAQIITFGKLQARAVVRDVGRVLQMSYGQVDKISKLIPNNPAAPVTLQEAINLEPALRKARDDDDQVARLLMIALQLEGLNRHASTHAAGVVIGDRRLSELVPLYRDARSTMPVVQYSMKYAEMAGLVKFDFLGLKTLTVISHSCKMIANSGVTIDIEKIPLDDKATYQMLSKGDAVGVFQFESAGMRDSLRKLQPDAIEDLIALGALYRPGPMDNIPTYIACKHGLEEPDYLHPSLEGILKETFGVIIYQEQVMQIAQVLSGYSLGAADLLRRAMGKKIKAEMDAQEQLFVTGAVAKGVDKKQASDIFNLVAKFAGYGFNKSHAAAYALLSYQTAYLKANYPVEFLASSMNLEINDTDKISIFCQEAKYLGIEILPPDINKSSALFTVETTDKGIKTVRYGLAGLKGVGVQAMEMLVEERNASGVFTNVFNLAERMDSKVINKRQLESLGKAGAFDELYANRHELLSNIDTIIRYSGSAAKEKASSQISLFDTGGKIENPLPTFESIPDFLPAERLACEREAIGFYLREHPLDNYRDSLLVCGITASNALESLPEGISYVKLAGIALDTRVKISPRGRFAYVQLSDSNGNYEVAIFDEELLNHSRELLDSATPVMLGVDARKDAGGVRLIANSVISLDEHLASRHATVTIWLDSVEPLAKIKALCGQSGKGKTRVIIIAQLEKYEAVIPLPETYPLTAANALLLKEQQGVVKVLHVAG